MNINTDPDPQGRAVAMITKSRGEELHVFISDGKNGPKLIFQLYRTDPAGGRCAISPAVSCQVSFMRRFHAALGQVLARSRTGERRSPT